ncbi:CD209 antigen-like protein C [Protopterus annectens]|uniref:CD209 antigen-like protein C n=1 Tax=Protopterus annectens TaxID=7888 RepID=UPI001CFA0BBD|nr:CD209 antigen-like protein C [Protopterus annectens]
MVVLVSPEDEAELNYAVVNFGKKSPSSDVINIQQNTNAPELEEEPSYVFIGSKLPSSGVTDAMEHAKARKTQEDVIKICKQHRKLLIISIIAAIILLTVIIAVTIGRNQSECCPEDWKIFNHSCYYFSLMGYNWSEAKEQCEKNQSTLVMIKSSKEQDFLNKTVRNGTDEYWIGLTDANHEGDWKWVNGESCKCTETNRLYWYDKEPDNWSASGSIVDEDCAIIKQDGGWSDTKCIDRQKWICEKLMSIC